jgi:hypothetical protein
MDTPKVAELAELALEALRDLEEAIHSNDRPTIDLKTEAIRQALFSIFEMTRTA